MSIFVKIWCFLMTIWLSEGTIIYSAQCRSRCYNLFESVKDQGKLSQCLSPCAQDYAKLGNCRTFCGDDNAPCHYSCKNYKSLYTKDYGSGKCYFKKHSYEYCDRNVRCDELRKCCVKTNTCEDIIVHGEEVKVVVSHITSSSLIARWEESNITGAVYIIQLREVRSRTIHYTDDDWTHWEQKLQSVKVTGVKFSGLHHGARVQLRVAIVNESGLQSIGPPSPVIRTLFNASKPSGPEQVWVVKKTYKQKTVSVTFSWKPPVILDVPVHSYRIYWKQIPVIKSDLAILTKKRTRVDGSQYNYTIENLKPDTMYHVEFEAICLWQKKRLKSPKVALNISTGHIKDNGRGIIDVIFNKRKSGKIKENKNSSKFYDDIKNIQVLIEKQDGGTHAPSKKPNKSAYNSGRRKHPNLWLTMLWVAFVLATFWTK